MAAMIKTSLAIPKALCNQAEILAQHLSISRNHLFGIAIENFIRNYQSQTLVDEITKTDQDQPDPNEQSRLSYQEAKPATQIGEAQLVINQGDIYWLQLENLSESEPSIRHPYVVIQDNVINHSRINT